MSADNQMIVKKIEDKWNVWMTFCSNNDYPGKPDKYSKKFDNELDAIHYAQDICDNDIVEYGIRIIRG